MAGASLNVSYQDLRDAKTKLDREKTEIEAQLTGVRTFLSGLVSSGFATQHASGKFDEAAETFVTGAKDVLKGLNDLGSYLAQTATALDEVDQALASKITLND